MIVTAVIFSFILYVLTGTIRFIQDLIYRDVTSAFYVRNPSISMTLVSILIWPLLPISRLIDNRRRLSFRYIFDFYLVGLFWGTSAFAASLTGLTKVLIDDDPIYMKVIKTIGVLVVYSAIIWWLYFRIRKIMERLFH
jgi:hypothetical protein